METENRKRQRRSTPAERLEILETFHRSGLTRMAFCAAHSIALSTLSKWLYNAKRNNNAPKPVLFREMKLTGVPAPIHQWAMEVVSPDGLMVRCREAIPIQDLAWLLRKP